MRGTLTDSRSHQTVLPASLQQHHDPGSQPQRLSPSCYLSCLAVVFRVTLLASSLGTMTNLRSCFALGVLIGWFLGGGFPDLAGTGWRSLKYHTDRPGWTSCDSGGLHLRQEGACFHRTYGHKVANVKGLNLNDLRLQQSHVRRQTLQRTINTRVGGREAPCLASTGTAC